MSIYNFQQYLSQDSHTLDLSDIITDKLLLNATFFFTFTAELNNYLALNSNITQLIIKPSLLREIIGIDTNAPYTPIASEPEATDSMGHAIMPFIMNNISKLTIKNGADANNINGLDMFGRSFYFFLQKNPQLNEIDCRSDSFSYSSTIIYPSNQSNQSTPFLTLIYSGCYPQDFYSSIPNGIHRGILEYYYRMTRRELAVYYEWVSLKGNNTVKGLNHSTRRPSADEKSWIGLKASDPLIHRNVSIPKIELLDPLLKPQQETNTRLQASFIMDLARRLLDEFRKPINLCFISIIIAGLIAINLPTNVAISAGIGIVSAIGFYALGRHSILPTRENAMQPYNSILGSYRIG